VSCASQIRWNIQLTCEEYVSQEFWRYASLPACPLHPEGGCGVQRHTAYARVNPPGTLIPRWYCAEGHVTISLLPDCFASRMSGSLVNLEQVVAEAEAAATLTLAAHELRGARWPGALRWLRRRRDLVRRTIVLVITLLPEVFVGCAPTLAAVRARLLLPVDACVLVRFREIAARHLVTMPPPVGFGPRTWGCTSMRRSRQHETGPPPRHRMS
jgi:hypothetical protein